jgi:hypothetical protein
MDAACDGIDAHRCIWQIECKKIEDVVAFDNRDYGMAEDKSHLEI